jgi:hypothetical protein
VSTNRKLLAALLALGVGRALVFLLGGEDAPRTSAVERAAREAAATEPGPPVSPDAGATGSVRRAEPSAPPLSPLSPATEAGEPAPTAGPRGSVSGVVVTADGAGVAGAALFLSHERHPRTGEEIGTSAADGTFLVEGLATGTAHLAARAEGLVSPWSPPVPVRADRQTTDVRIVVRPEVVLRGRLFDRDTGAGVAGRILFRSGIGGRTVVGEAGEDGRYEARPLLMGDRLDVGVAAPGYGYAYLDGPDATGDRPGVFGGRNTFQLDEELIERGFDVPVRRLPLHPEELVVVDRASGAPVEGALLGLPVAGLPGEHEVVARTGPDGRATHAGGWPWRAQVTAAGYAERDLQGAEADAAGVLVVPLDPERPLEVRVLAGGRPHAGARVDCRAAPRGDLGRFGSANEEFPLLSSATSDAEGRVVLHAPPYVRELLLVADGPPAGTSGPVRVPLPLAAPVVLELRPAGVLLGSVRPSGRRVPPQMVLAVHATGFASTAAVGEDGLYRFALPAGEYGVRVEEGAPTRVVTDWEFEAELATVTSGGVTRLDLEGFGSVGRLEGLLLADEVPAAFQPIHLRADRGDGARPLDRDGATDAGGRFVFEELPPGAWEVQWLSSDGERTVLARREVDVLAGATADVTLAPDTGTVEITVVDRGTGELASFEYVTVASVDPGGPGDPGVQASYLVPEGGVVTLRLPPGSYRLWAVNADEETILELTSGATERVTLLVGD